MNRIVLIGNGFDLSCGLKTSYQDFLVFLLKTAIHDYIHNGIIPPKELFELKSRGPLVITKIDEVLKPFKTIEDFNKSKQINIHSTNSMYFSTGGGDDYFSHNEYLVIIFPKSQLFEDLLLFEKWNNIESHYFHLLVEHHKEVKSNSTEIKRVKDLNKHFNTLKKEFYKYLCLVNKYSNTKDHSNKYISSIAKKITEPLKVHQSFDPKGNGILNNKLEDVIIVSFNYTDLIFKHLSETLSTISPRYDKVYIHGNLESENEIVFGYGDETHVDYLELEQSGYDEYLENMKSTYYSSNFDFKLLMNTIDSNQYDVFVLGHSMGLSDRVLLKAIFENDNCISIRMFHRGTKNSHGRKSMYLTRHYDDKIEMRKKIYYDEDAILNSD